MKEEREMLFGFTESDHSAWTGAGSNHRHDESFLDEINAARFHHDIDTAGNGDENSASSTTSHHPSATFHGDFAVHRSASSHAPTDSHTATQRVDALARTHHAPTSDEFFSHVSADGASVRMVDVGGKAMTQRVAVAQTRVVFPPEVVEAFEGKEWVGPKGPIFATAKLAGIMAAKYVRFVWSRCNVAWLSHSILMFVTQADKRAHPSVPPSPARLGECRHNHGWIVGGCHPVRVSRHSQNRR
jgi:MoaC family